jgi:uncharacterized low-complexity protein
MVMATLKIKVIGCCSALERDMRGRCGEGKSWENKVKNLDGKCIKVCYTS